MNYTKNYHLPQWAETDRIQMEDFNQAMENIDQVLRYGLTPEDTSCQYGDFSFSKDTAEESVLKTFSFAPSIMILDFGGSLHLLFSGAIEGVIFGSSNYNVTFSLEQNTIKLKKKDDRMTSSSYSGRYVIFP